MWQSRSLARDNGREVAHAHLHPPDRHPEGAGEQVKHDRPWRRGARLLKRSFGQPVFAGSVVAIQIPKKTATKPTTRFKVIGSSTSCVASSAAAMGLTVMVLATRVGVARSSARTQRMKASAPPPLPRYAPAIHCGVRKSPRANT